MQTALELLAVLPWPAAIVDDGGAVVGANAAWQDDPALTRAAARMAERGEPWEGVVLDSSGGAHHLRVRPLGGAGARHALVLRQPPEVDQLARMTRRLEQAHHLQRGLLDSIPDIAWLKDAEGRFLAVNQALVRTVGAGSADAMVGKTDLDFSPVDLAERYRADDRAVMETRQPRRVEEPHIGAAGERIWIETIKVPIVDDRDVVIGTAGVARNVTERKMAEEVRSRAHAQLEASVAQRTEELARANEALTADLAALARAEETHRRLVAILEATTDMVGIADMEGRALYVNRAGRRLLGISDQADVSGLRIADFHPAWATKVVLEQGMAAAVRDGVWVGETALRNVDGREIPVSQLLLAHRDASGRPEFVSTIARDMTELKSLQDRLLQAQKLEAMGRLAGGVAHDFNNLLTVIQAALVFAERTLPPVHPARAELAQIGAAATRAADLTRQLLSFARKQVLAPSLVSLTALVLGADKLLRRLLGEHVELVTLTDPAIDPVRVDPGQFENVILNLALNARDAMPLGGTLTIETRNLVVGEDEGGDRAGVEPGRWVELRVSDTGTGIPEEALPHIFEPFFTTKSQGEGTGLGLASCYGIVRQAQGHIRVSSRAGAGSTFVVLVPAAVESAAAKRPSARPRGIGGRETILLVEDEPQVRALAVRALEELGYRVLAASSGAEGLAVESGHRGPLDLIISDIVMPQMSGLQMVAEIVRSRGEQLVLFVSGYAAEVMDPGSLPVGTHFLAKPFSPDQLASRVRGLLDEAAARRPPAEVVPLRKRGA